MKPLRIKQVVRLAIPFLTVGIFFLDVLTPFGIADWVFYFIPLLLSFYAGNRFSPVLLITVFSVLTVAGAFWSSAGLQPGIALTNIILGLGTLWAAALLMVRLRRSDQFLQSVLDSVSAHIAILDAQGKIISVNSAWRQFARENNYLGDDFGLGTNYLTLCESVTGDAKPEASSVVNGIRKVMAGECVELHMDYSCHSPQASRWFVVRATRLQRSWRPGIVVTHENITERKQAEESLQQSSRQLQLVLRAGGMGAFEHTLHDDRVLVSPEFCQVLELPVRSSIGHDEWVGRMHPADRGAILPRVQEMERSQNAFDFEYRICLPGDKTRWIRAMAAPLYEDGKIERIHGVIQDITSRKQAELELRKLSRAIEQSPVSIIITDLRGRIEYVNPKFCTLAGYPADEVLGKTPRLLKSGKTSPETYSRMWAAITAGEEWSGEFHNRKKSGELYWESASISALRDDQGKVTHFIAVKEDITERRRESALLLDNQQRLELATRSAQIGIWDWDLLANHKVWDAQMHALYGIREQDYDDSFAAWQKRLHPDDRDRVVADMHNALSGRKDYNTDFRVVWPNGEVRYLEGHAIVHRAHDGSAVRMIGVNMDITGRKLAEDALKEQLALQERLAKIASNAPGVIYSFRLRPDRAMCVPYASPSIEEFFGVRAEDIVTDASPLLNRIHPEDQSGVDESIAESARTLLPWRAEFRVRHPKNGLFWVEGQSTPEREADGSVLWHGFMSDITERKRVAQELAERKLNEAHARLALEHEQRSSQIKDQFVSMVSHEFRTPLSIINVAAELLDGYLDELTEAERSEHLNEIKSSVERMTQMMNDFLIYGKCAGQKFEPQPAWVEVEALCRKLITEVPGNAGSPTPIECAVDPAVGEAWLDEKVLRHIVGNLLGNAVKYSIGGQAVTLEVRQMAGSPQSNGGTDPSSEPHIEFKISDSGIGIPAADLTKLYQTFHRAANVGNRPGTGMGLAIVKQFVDLLGGRIRFESQEGKGTTVWVVLPVLDPGPRRSVSNQITLCTEY